jgi:hypothetical protein
MSEITPKALVVYRLDALRQDLEVVGVYTHRDEAEAHLAQLPTDSNPLVITMTMDAAMAVLRGEGQSQFEHIFERRLERLAERVGQLAAVVAAKQVA